MGRFLYFICFSKLEQLLSSLRAENPKRLCNFEGWDQKVQFLIEKSVVPISFLLQKSMTWKHVQADYILI